MAVNANTLIYDNAVDRAAMIRLYEKRVKDKVELVLNGHSVRVDKLIKGAKASPQGFIKLREAIDQELQKTYKSVYSTSSRSLLDLFNDQASYAYQNIEVTAGKIWRTRRPTRRIAEEIVLKKPLYNNQILSEGWSGVSQREKIRLDGVMRKGIADGLSPKEIALNVRKGNVHNITRYQARTLVTTAITSVQAQADQAVYEANDKLLAGWQYVAVIDSATTPICIHRNATIYPSDDIIHLPPAHYNCRSTTVPVVKSWEDLSKLEGIAEIRKRNFNGLSASEKTFYDGQTPPRESYDGWLRRQPLKVQLRHMGDYQRLALFQKGEITADKFINYKGQSASLKEVRRMTEGGHVLPGNTRKFAQAKEQLDAMRLGAISPDDFYSDPALARTLFDYYLLQAGELNGILSATNFRGTLLHNKRAMRFKVLAQPPRDDQIKFNPITGRYEDVRLYQPAPSVLANNIRLLREDKSLLDRDKAFIEKFIDDLDERMSMNERAVVADNLRIIFTRYRKNPEPWVNFKGVVQGQIKFDIINVSDAIETQIRRDSNVLKRLLESNYVDPVLGATQFDELHDTFIDNIIAKNRWEDSTAPKIARELRTKFDNVILKKHPIIWDRLDDGTLQQFYLKMAHRLSLADSPDRDQFAVALGRDLYNLANFNGSRREWYSLGMDILNTKNVKKFFEIETFGVQKRRMKSRMSGAYFGPYYDTMAYNIRVTDPRIQQYAQLTRKVDVGLRVGVTSEKNRLVFREGYKTYFIKRDGVLIDSRIPITSTSSYSDFPESFIDKDMVDALNWAGKAEYRIDEDFYDFVNKLLYFEDDRGNAKKFNELNEYRKYMAARGDSYERIKAMEWLRNSGKSFSNNPFIDHRARIYDRGFIGPQSGETFRPFLNTAQEKAFSKEAYLNLRDQVGSFLGGLDDYFEKDFDGLTFTGRQKIAQMWNDDMVAIGNHMLRAKPADLRAILQHPLVLRVDGEEQGKFFRFAIEMAKIDRFLKTEGVTSEALNLKAIYSDANLERLSGYKTALALEQDASSSGAQIIALTTKNKQLAELSNVVPTSQKRRLYDEIALATYNDPRFQVLNEKLGLTEKDLRKAAKAQNMVTLYGAGERTGILNVEAKLAKILDRTPGTLIVKASDRDTVLNEISARAARYDRFAPETALELRALRTNIRDIFNKGTSPGHELMEQLYFLDPKTRDLIEKLSQTYNKTVTPDDFKQIAQIMSGHLAEQVPILKDFTKFLGRLAADYLTSADPSKSAFDWEAVLKTSIRGSKKKGYVLPDRASEILGLKAGEALSEKFLKRYGWWKPNGSLSEVLYGVAAPETRRTGVVYDVTIAKVKKIWEMEIFKANKLPQSWTNVPWVNFNGKILEQNFTQSFEEKLLYKDKFGKWTTNILQVSQKTSSSWLDETLNKSGKINDIVDIVKARTAYAVNGNHSNDAVLVKQFHLWGKKTNTATSTIHDAFFTNAADMIVARRALRSTYADVLEANTIKMTLDEMLQRGLPRSKYDAYLEEAIKLGLIPVAGKSKVGDKLLTEEDILKTEDILRNINDDFSENYGWYGVN